MREAQLPGSLWPLILVYTTFSIPLGVLILVRFVTGLTAGSLKG